MTSIFSFQPRYPIWKQIKEFLKPQEENEVRTILGENMLIRNDIAHQEVESLLSIILLLLLLVLSDERRSKYYKERINNDKET